MFLSFWSALKCQKFTSPFFVSVLEGRKVVSGLKEQLVHTIHTRKSLIEREKIEEWKSEIKLKKSNYIQLQILGGRIFPRQKIQVDTSKGR